MPPKKQISRRGLAFGGRRAHGHCGNPLSVFTRVARTLLPPSWPESARRIAVGQGWLPEPPFQYPFDEMLRVTPSNRPYYHWGTLCGAFLARNLGLTRMSIIEFGVAGGNGLLDLEASAAEVERVSGVTIDVFGFDTGHGLPRPRDER